MGDKYPLLPSREIISVLLKKGFSFKSQEGSHAKYTQGSLTAIVPIHNKSIKRGTLKNILSQAKISLDDLVSALNKRI